MKLGNKKTGNPKQRTLYINSYGYSSLYRRCVWAFTEPKQKQATAVDFQFLNLNPSSPILRLQEATNSSIMRGRSYSPSPPPRGGYGRRGQRSPSPRGRYSGGRGSSRDLPTSLLVRNLRHDCRPEDLRRPFGQFGVLKDIYLPKDYYTGEPRGFGFVQFVDPSDAEEAKYQMDGQLLLGREITVVFAEENRKKPSDMRHRERPSSRTTSRYRDQRRSPPRYSRSPPPRRARSRSHSRDYYSPPKRRDYSRSVSPLERRYSREKSFSRSPPPYEGSRSRSQSPVRGPSRSRSRSHSPRRSIRRSRSPINEDYPREPNIDRSPSP